MPYFRLCWEFLREERRLGLLHQQHFRRTLCSWPTSRAAWQVQSVDRWCGDGAGMVLWDDAWWPCGIARSSYGARGVCVPTVTTAMSHWLCHFLPKSISTSEVLGQGIWWQASWLGTTFRCNMRLPGSGQKRISPFTLFVSKWVRQQKSQKQ